MYRLPTSARWLALLAALAVVAVACSPDRPDEDDEHDEQISDPTGEPVDGGTLVFGHEREPGTLNPLLRRGNSRGTWLVSRTILLGAYALRPDASYVPELLDGEAEVDEGDEFTVTWRIREEAEWSDGTPITADDFQFTYDTVMDAAVDIATRAGYELMTDTERVDDRTWRATFDEPYAPYRTLFTTFPVLPAHVLEGADIAEVWDGGIVDPETGEPIASGPFQFDEWEPGQQLSVVRNEAFWGDAAKLDGITFRYLDPSSLVQALRDGEVDLFDPQPNPDLVSEVEDIDGVELQREPGRVWEHLYLNLDSPALSNGAVREAIIRALDRDAIVEALLGDVDPHAETLQNVLLLQGDPHHEPHWDRYDHDPDAAVRLLEDGGCSRDDDGGLFECGDEPLVLRYVSTAGNERREQLFEIVRDQLAAIGVELEEDFQLPQQALSRQLPEGDFDLINFGWSGGHDPSGSDVLFRCGGASNHNGYCSEKLDEQLDEGLRTLDEGARAAIYNAADERIAGHVPLVPLYQLPELLAYGDHVGGVRASATPWGPAWNASEWFLTQ